MFNHQDEIFVPIERETIDGVRYYKVFGTEELIKMPSITSVISWRNRDKFKKWRTKVGEQEANNITRKATHRGTDAHTLIEEYLNNSEWIEDYFVQCAAYACMLYEMKGLIVKKFVIIMTCENGEVEIYEEYDKKKYINLLGKYITEFVEFKLQEYAKP
jgi:heme-degrading monooxygenase HmoA